MKTDKKYKRVSKLILTERIFDQLKEQKRVTIRKDRKNIQLGDLILESDVEHRKCIVRVIRVSYCQFGNIYCCETEKDGFKNHNDMFEKMKQFYPTISFESEMTVIAFTHLRFEE
jgi:hypothetical protein